MIALPPATVFRCAVMPIQPFLAGQAFAPEIIRQMSIALETVCEKLGLNLTDDPATRLVASKIIELAQRGVRDAATLSEMTLKDLSR
jgi:hypothetical protein